MMLAFIQFHYITTNSISLNSSCSTLMWSTLCELLLMHYYSNTKMFVKQTFIPYFKSSHRQLNTQRVLTSKNIIPPNYNNAHHSYLNAHVKWICIIYLNPSNHAYPPHNKTCFLEFSCKILFANTLSWDLDLKFTLSWRIHLGEALYQIALRDSIQIKAFLNKREWFVENKYSDILYSTYKLFIFHELLNGVSTKTLRDFILQSRRFI